MLGTRVTSSELLARELQEEGQRKPARALPHSRGATLGGARVLTCSLHSKPGAGQMVCEHPLRWEIPNVIPGKEDLTPQKRSFMKKLLETGCGLWLLC